MKFKHGTFKNLDDCKSNYIYSTANDLIFKNDIVCLSINGVVLSHNEFVVNRHYYSYNKTNSSEIVFKDSNSTLKKDDIVNVVYNIPDWFERWIRQIIVRLSD